LISFNKGIIILQTHCTEREGDIPGSFWLAGTFLFLLQPELTPAINKLVKKLGFLLKILSLYPVPVADPGFDLRLSSVPGFCYIAFTILFKMNRQ